VPTSVASLEYMLIGVASSLWSDTVLNEEKQNLWPRLRRSEKLTPDLGDLICDGFADLSVRPEDCSQFSVC
jgi:hypothetical protein